MLNQDSGKWYLQAKKLEHSPVHHMGAGTCGQLIE